MVNTKKVGDMSVDELREVIKETFQEMIDPDYGLEITPEVKKQLNESLQSEERISMEKAAKQIGLEW